MNTQKGFTLLELMIVVVIVALIAAIAIPNYQPYVIKTRRTAATGCLLEMSQALERFHTKNLTCVGFSIPSMECSNKLTEHYTFSLADQAARAYTLSATPQGAQHGKDPASCGTLTVNQAGVKGAGGDISVCWK